MSDFGTMRNRIARETRFVPTAASSGVDTEISEAIRDAIKFYELEAFWFNEQQRTTTTTAGQDYYALPDDYVDMKGVSLLNTGRWDVLEAVAFSDIENTNFSTQRRRPRGYCVFNKQLRLAPVPDAVYTVRMTYIRRLSADPLSQPYRELTADTDTNEWMTDGEQLIRYHACALLYAGPVKNDDLAAKYYAMAQRQLDNFRSRAIRYIGTGQIRPQVF